MKCRCSNCGWLEVNPSGAMFCGYSDERTWENESCLAWKDKDETKTNADRIRGYTDEELAEMMAHGNCGYCKIHDYCFSQKGVDCDEAWLDWLKQEVKDD